MGLCVVHLHEQFYVVIAVGLMFCNVKSRAHHDDSADLLGFAIGLQRICSRKRSFNDQTDSACRKALYHVLQLLVGQQHIRDSVLDDLTGLKYGHCSSSDSSRDHHGSDQF